MESTIFSDQGLHPEYGKTYNGFGYRGQEARNKYTCKNVLAVSKGFPILRSPSDIPDIIFHNVNTDYVYNMTDAWL